METLKYNIKYNSQLNRIDSVEEANDEVSDTIFNIELKRPRKSFFKPPTTSLFNNTRRRSSISANGLIQIQRNKIRYRWKLAIKKLKIMKDPWAGFSIEKYPAEKAVLHNYDANRDTWTTQDCIIKMETEPFGHGAMRICYRVKMLVASQERSLWGNSSNHVAKRYMTDEVDRDCYFDDAQLQNDAKYWAARFNKHNPPKKVDIIQVSILELVEREDSPLYHFERYIDGKYIKYNSNSGFVRDDSLRNTPQAFSHYTFEYSNHELIVVDIQGVGDLYTDPQIHTKDGDKYGDGNLGIKGMALFFNTHFCNDICKQLGLTEFDLAESEKEKNKNYEVAMKQRLSITVKRSTEIGSAQLHNHLKNLHLKALAKNEDDHKFSDEIIEESEYEALSSPPPVSSLSLFNQLNVPPIAHRDVEIKNNPKAYNARRASCVVSEKLNHTNENRESILASIHFELCKYHESGRFVHGTEDVDLNAGFFHLEQAADLGLLEAIVAISKIYLNMPREILADYEATGDSEDNINRAYDYVYKAALNGDRESMLSVAKAFDTGSFHGNEMNKNWKNAVYWYNKLLETSDESDQDDPENASEPTYLILARVAEIYQNGGNGIEKDLPSARDMYNEAAEKAMSLGKGKLANKYLMNVETISSEID